jgi:aldose 1-epimerase
MLNSEFRFKVIQEEFGTIPSYRLLDSDTGEFVTILPSFGGSLHRMALRKDDNLVEILDAYSTEQEMKKTLASSFKGSNLFPFPNRIKEGKYSFGGKAYQFPLNFPQESNAIHGLVFDQPFKVVDHEDGEIGCVLILEYTSDSSPGYPFKYMLKIIYRLTAESGFECKMKISNMTDQSLPAGHGWHPYFMANTKKIDEVWLQFPATSILAVDDRNIPTGESSEYHEFNTLKQIQNTVLDNCFLLADTDDRAEIILQNKKDNFGYKIWQETGKYKYNFLQVYTPPTRKSIAIEPMTCAPDAFNNQNGLIKLGPLESISATWGISHLE